jgi:hypothetical protein
VQVLLLVLRGQLLTFSLFVYGISIAGEKEPRLFESGVLLQMFTNSLRPCRYALECLERVFSETCLAPVL